MVTIIEDKEAIRFVNGLWRYDGSTFTKVSQRGAYAIIEDKKGNIWTTGAVNPMGRSGHFPVMMQKSLYNKKPTVTEIMSGEPECFWGFWKLTMEVFGLELWDLGGVYRYDGKTITDFKSKEGQK